MRYELNLGEKRLEVKGSLESGVRSQESGVWSLASGVWDWDWILLFMG